MRPDQEKVLDIIAADHPHDVVSCCKCLFKKWLDTTTDATWNQLIRALRTPSIQLDYLAGRLEQMNIECKGHFSFVLMNSYLCRLVNVNSMILKDIPYSGYYW